jgi:acyl carrier protein
VILTAIALEERLLRFTREKLVAPDAASSITTETRLFEDRVVDSLKVLELIAFVQSAIGRKIPDSQIVLANFKTIETIARVFTSDVAPDQRRRSRRQARTAAVLSASPVEQLIARGDMELTSDGSLRVREDAAALYEYLDSTVRGWAEELGATSESYPEQISLETLQRAGFLEAFPDKLVRSDDAARPPAVCYHHYPALADRSIASGGSVVTAVGRCYRNEFDLRAAHPEERLRSFTMREIIGIGDAEFVEGLQNDLIDRTRIWVKDLGLDGHITTANDPFFTSESRGRAIMQQLLPLKYELQLRAGSDGRTVAAASFNNHHEHFARAFSIRLPSGAHANSGCVAFGWERWLIAFINQHGINQSNWPELVRGRDVAAV